MQDQALTSQMRTKQPEMLRGYDPLREMDHWDLIISGFCMETGFICLLLQALYTSQDSLNNDYPLINMISLPLMALLLLSLGLGVPFAFARTMRKQQKQRFARRLALLQRTSQADVLVLPVLERRFPLPISLASHLKKGSLSFVCAGIGLLMLLIVFTLIMTANQLLLPVLLGTLPALIILYCLLSAMFLASRLLKYNVHHFFQPELAVDHEGITARYGRDTIIRMRWQEIRYLALTSSSSTRISTKKAPHSEYRENEAFEICDGENMICWRAAAPARDVALRRLFDEAPFSSLNYNAFAIQLAALVIEHAGLPLCDLRPPVTRRKKRLKSRAEKSAEK